MLHIVTGCDDNYVKYTAVVIMSILQNSTKGQAYNFHLIMPQEVSEVTKRKIQDFEKELKKNYSVIISQYFIDENYYSDLAKWSGCYAAYYRLRIGEILPATIDKCLYLGVDILIFQNIESLFSIDMQGKTVAMVKDLDIIGKKRVMRSRNSKVKDFILPHPEYYSNSEIILVNLKQWREREIGIACEKMLFKYTRIDFPDQDILNAVLGSDICLISPKWNFFVTYLYEEFFSDIIIYADSCQTKNLLKMYDNVFYCSLSRNKLLEEYKDVYIMHFAGYHKPWSGQYYCINETTYECIKYPHYDDWWKVAKSVPVFKEDLINVYNTTNSKESYYITEIKTLQKKLKDADYKIKIVDACLKYAKPKYFLWGWILFFLKSRKIRKQAKQLRAVTYINK